MATLKASLKRSDEMSEDIVVDPKSLRRDLAEYARENEVSEVILVYIYKEGTLSIKWEFPEEEGEG